MRHFVIRFLGFVFFYCLHVFSACKLICTQFHKCDMNSQHLMPFCTWLMLWYNDCIWLNFPAKPTTNMDGEVMHVTYMIWKFYIQDLFHHESSSIWWHDHLHGMSNQMNRYLQGSVILSDHPYNALGGLRTACFLLESTPCKSCIGVILSLMWETWHPPMPTTTYS